MVENGGKFHTFGEGIAELLYTMERTPKIKLSGRQMIFEVHLLNIFEVYLKNILYYS